MSSRTEQMKRRMLDAIPTISSERASIFTGYLQTHEEEPIKIRLANAFADVLSKMTIRIEPDEKIIGNMGPTPRSCQVFPEYSWQWIAAELDRFDKRRTERFLISAEDKESLRRSFEYWRGKSTAEIASKEMPKESQKASRAGLFTIGAPGTGIGHVIVDYPQVIRNGLISLIADAEQMLGEATNEETKDFYRAVIIQLKAVIQFAHRFSELAAKMAGEEKEPERKAELLKVSHICARVPEYPAETFHEALQSFWFIHLLVQTESNGHSMSTGRFDQYMYPFFERDLESEMISKDETQELLEMLWIKFTSLVKVRDEYYSTAFAGHPMFQNLTIGGQNEHGADACNELTSLILETTKSIRVTQPTVSFRWHENVAKRYLNEVVAVISAGLGMPGIFNDRVIMPIMVAKGVDEGEAYDYSILGCVEPIIGGKSDSRQNIGYVNLAKILEITLNNGYDPMTGESVGLETGDARQFTSFNQLWDAYTRQVDYTIELLTRADQVAAKILSECKPTPFISSLLVGCLESGKTMQEGGAIYNSGGIMGVGIAIVADSMEMIRKHVFEKKTIGMGELLDALCANFEGHEKLKAILTNDPSKYGNDIETVDMLARDVGITFCDSIQSRMTTRNGPYHGALFSVSMYIPQGQVLGATPDGRKAGIMLSDGVSPAQNRDMKGPTAAMKSVARLDHCRCFNGTLYNMKFTPDILSNARLREKFIALIQAYFRMGGLHVQFNILDRATLEDAKVNPMAHRNLIVRVAGYSAYFIELDPFVQDEIIARTEFSSSL